MNFYNLFSNSYWFSQPQPVTGSLWWVHFGIFAGLTLAGLILLVVRSNQSGRAMRTLLGRYAAFGITMGLLGLMHFMFRQENVFFLAWRFWLVFWAVISVWWIGSIVLYHVNRMPQIKVENQKRERKDQYLPKAKK